MFYFQGKPPPHEKPFEYFPIIHGWKIGKPLALIMEANLEGIKRVEPMTSPTLGRDLKSSS
jgi:hypothetical protein